jgi:hypothetical protein
MRTFSLRNLIWSRIVSANFMEEKRQKNNAGEEQKKKRDRLSSSHFFYKNVIGFIQS